MSEVAIHDKADLHIIEGAMGTMLFAHGVEAGSCNEALNLDEPDAIAAIHRAYVEAGADCVCTNTFGATRPRLSGHGMEDRFEDINRAAVRIARSSGAKMVLGDVGPCGLMMDPLGTATPEEVTAAYSDQVRILADAGVDAILIETMIDIQDALCALRGAKEACDLPVYVTCTFGAFGRMDFSGTDPASAARMLEEAGADAVGINCGLGPEQVFPLIEQMLAATDLPVVVQPNAGLPEIDDEGATVYSCTADEMGQWARRFVDAGATWIGSCCGSTPDFTAAIVAAVR